MAKNPRLLLGRTPDGKQALRITKPGYNVMESNPMTQPGRFSFASDWDRVDRVLQVGSYGATFGDGGQITNFCYIGPLPYSVPMISLHLRTGGAGSSHYDSRWAKIPSGGTDDYTTSYWAHWTSAYYIAIQSAGSGNTRALNGTWYFSYIIWDLPGA